MHVSGYTLAGHQASTKASLSLLSTTRQWGEKSNEGFMACDKEWDISLTKYRHRRNRLELGTSVEFFTDKIRVGKWEVKTDFKNTSHYFSIPPSSTYPMSASKGDRE